MNDLQPVQVLDFSRERMADRSNGILEFSVNHDFQDANVFHFWERYTSNASLGLHNTQPEVTQFMENVSAGNYMASLPVVSGIARKCNTSSSCCSGTSHEAVLYLLAGARAY